MQKLLLTLLLITSCFGYNLNSQSLAAGDIAFVGYNTDTPDGFAFITLTDIPAGTEIYFTDQGWSSFNNTWYSNGEDHIIWTAPSGGLSMGTIVSVVENTSDSFTSSYGTANLASGYSGFSLSAGDSMIAYTSGTGAAPPNPNFLAAIYGDDNYAGVPGCDDSVTKWFDCQNCTQINVDCNTTSVSTSDLPTGLTNGVNAVALFPDSFLEQDNAQYTGTLTGTVEQVRIAINNRNNWSFNDGTPYSLAAGTYSSPNITPEVTNTAPSIGGITAGQTVNDNATINLFSGITIADADGDNVTATISLDNNAKGVITGASSGTGPYTITSRGAAAMQTALRSLSFNPTDNRTATSETTTFTVTINDGTANTNDNTTTVISSAVAPTVSSVSVPSNDTYIISQNLDFTVNFNEAVTVNTGGGIPQLSLTIGAATRQATFLGGSGTTNLQFRYTVQSGDLDTDGIAVGTLATGGGTLRDSGGKDANLTLNAIGATTNVLVDAVAPRVSSIVRQNPTTSPTNADALVWDLTFNEAVSNTSIADFTVTGTTATIASVTNPSGTVYRVTVSGGDLAGLNGTVTLGFSGSQNISDVAGNALTNTTPTGTNTNTFVVENKIPLTITGLTGDDKVYDGTTAATASGTASLSGVLGADDVSLSGTPVFTFASADVGTGIAITTTGYTISGADAGNYTLTQPALSADITTKEVIITGLTGDDKEYDGTTTATASGTASLSGVETTDVVSLGGTPVFTFASADVGTGIAITTTGYTLSGADAGNYTLTQPGLSADITTKSVTIKGITGDDKEYDGTTAATASGTASLSGVETTDVVSVGGTPVFTFASADVGTGIAITTTGYTLSGADAGNYTLTQPGLSADITTKALTITGITGDDKEYDGTTAATASGTASLSGVVGADGVSLGGTPVFTFASADVGTGIGITTTGYTISGADAGNYTLTQPTLSADITTKVLTITGITGDDKEYDGTTAATASGTALLSGVETTDVVSLGGTPVFTFASADVGTGIAITTTGYTLSGADAGNYTLTQPTLSADITSKAVTITGITGDDKEYDGTTAATATGTALLSGVETTDVVSLGGTPVFTFGSADAGTGIAITTTGYTISGANAGNYTLTQPTLSADITTKAVTITGLNGDDKEYDGTTTATASGTALLNGVVGADVVSLGGTPVFTFTSADVGTGIAITTTGYTISGADAGNYTLTQPGLSADITTKAVTITGITGDDKEYDGTTAATASGTASLSGLETTDVVSLGGTPVFTFASADVGTGIGITTTGYTLSGADAGNYTLTQPGLSADITTKALTITGITGDDKEYDGTTAANASGTASLSGLESTDVVSLGGTPVFTFASADVGTGIAITTTGYTISGADAGNYTLTQPDLSADITTKAVTITGITGDDKEYDGTTAATASGTASLSGLETTDVVSLGGTPVFTFASADVGTGIAITTTGYTISGADAGNYTLTQPGLSADITSKAVTITGITGDNKEYDGTTAATASGTASLRGLESTDVVSLGGTPVFTFGSADVGTGITITTTGYTISGADAGNYTLTQPGLSADITTKALTITGITGDDKEYDGTTTATATGTASLSGVETTDVVSLGGTPVFSFASADVGTGIAITTTGYTISGTDAGNYSLTQPTLAADITTKALTITGITGDDKEYDGTTTATATGTASLSGIETTDVVSLGGTPVFTFASADVGTGIAITTTSYTLSGADAGNYTLTQPTLSADITTKALTITGITGDDKEYDGTTVATATGTASLSGVESTDVVSLGGTPVFTFGSADVGTGITITTTGYTVSGTDAGNYTLTQPGLSADINPLTLVVEADAQTKVYGSADPSLTYQVTSGSLIGSDAFSGSLTRITGETVGTYEITQGSLGLNSNYDLSYISNDLTISKATITVTADNQTKIYGGADPALTVSYSGFENGDSELDLGGTLNVTRTTGESVGSYVISASGATSTNYDITYIAGSFEIIPAALTITADDQTKVYGESDPALTVSYSGFENGDSELDLGGTLNISRTSGEAVGSYVISASGNTSTNYDITYIASSFEITPAALTITADDQTKVYGESDPDLTVSYSGFENGDSESDLGGTLNISRTSGEAVGGYVISASGTTSTNYDITYIAGSFEITPAALTITADDQTKVYGESDPALTVSYSGFENGDSESDLGGTLNVTRTTGESVGSYVISASGATSMNYSITYIDGDFEITPAALTITADDQTKVYGESDPALTVSYSGFENGDSELDLGGTLNISRTTGESVGSYVISASGATSMNYSITYIAGSFEITPAALTITADDQTKVYGESDPALTVSYSGFENGDSESDLGGTLNISRDSGEAVGSYVIRASGATSTNYDITYIDGNFEITPAALTITADDQTKIYGESDPALTVSYSGFENGDSELDLGDTLNISRTTGESVGSYVIRASGATSTNYDVTYIDGNFEITPAALTITADDQTKVYGAADPALTVSYSGFENGDSESNLGGTLNISRDSGESVGSYVISASGATSMNYSITYIDGNFEITPAALTITADDQTKVYGESDPDLTVSYSGFENGDSESDLGGTLNISRTIGESVGIYVISASGATSTNYDVTYIAGSFEITLASQTITFNPLPVLNLESDDDFQLQAVASSGLPVSYSYTYTSDVPAAMVSADGFVSLVQSGNIVITASQSGNENYSPATSVSQELEITSSEASIRSLFIGDEVFTNPDSQIIYVIDCDDTAQELVVSYETEENAESDSPKSFTVDVAKPGIYRYAITISSQDGTNTMTYNIEIHKRFIFDEIVVQKFNNTLLVNNNPATNGGYRFVAFKWYKNGNVVGNGQYFSEGDEATDMLDPLANYSVTLTTEEGDVLSTCDFTIELDVSSKIKLAPNPVQANASTTLFANFEKEELKNMKVSILTMSGTLIDTFYTSSSKSTIQMPASIQAGVYILVCETSKQTQTVQFIVH